MSERPSVVTAIVLSDHGVLLCRRHDGKPEWSFPGGEVEAGESWADTAERECAEETGLTVVPGEVLGERVHPKTGRHMAYVACDAAGDTRVKVGDPDEHSEVGWYSLEQAREMLPGLDEPVEKHLETHLPARAS